MRDKENVKKDAVPEVLREPHRYAIRPFRIAGNLYYVGNTSVGAHLIDTGGGLLLIDTAYSRTLPLLVNSIWEAGFSPYDIKYILHSHGHYDHFGGTNELAALSRAKTFLGAEDARMFRERPELALAPPSCPYCYEELFTPDFEMEDGGIISLGNTEIKTVWTPGHSPGVMSFIITVTDGNTRYSAGMHGGSGLNTLNIEFLKKYKLDPEKTRNDFLLSLKKLKKEKVDITLGNHPDQNRTVEKREKTLKNPDAPNPFIDPGEWEEFLSGIEKRFAAMIAEEAGRGA